MVQRVFERNHRLRASLFLAPQQVVLELLRSITLLACRRLAPGSTAKCGLMKILHSHAAKTNPPTRHHIVSANPNRQVFVFTGGLAQERTSPPQATCSAIPGHWHSEDVEIEIYICTGRPTLATVPGLKEFLAPR